VAGLHVIAQPAALDAAAWSSAGGSPVTVLRVAPDEAIGLGATAVAVGDDHAVVAEEQGLVAARCGIGEIMARIEWHLPAERPALVQGAVAGVPARLWLTDADHVLLVTWAAYAHDLADRLGWLP
jgi:hypothetical protein